MSKELTKNKIGLLTEQWILKVNGNTAIVSFKVFDNDVFIENADGETSLLIDLLKRISKAYTPN